MKILHIVLTWFACCSILMGGSIPSNGSERTFDQVVEILKNGDSVSKRKSIARLSASNINESQAIKIALEEIKRNRGIGKYEAHATKEEGGWSVLIWALPKKPGGFTEVHVTITGKVANIVHGK